MCTLGKENRGTENNRHSTIAKNLLAGCECKNCSHMTRTTFTSSYGEKTRQNVCENKNRCEEKGQGYANYLAVVLDERGTCEYWNSNNS